MLFVVVCCLALLTSGVKSDEQSFEQTTTILNPDEVKDVSQNTEEQRMELPNTESSNTEINNKFNNEKLDNEPDTTLTTTSPTNETMDVTQEETNYETTSTESISELPNTENKENSSNTESSYTEMKEDFLTTFNNEESNNKLNTTLTATSPNTQQINDSYEETNYETTSTEASVTDSPNTEMKVDTQSSEALSTTIPSNSYTSSTKPYINEASNEFIANVTKANQTVEDVNIEEPTLEPSNARNGTIFIERPNIVFIVADDLGWDDVSYHGSDQIITPNIDNLAYQSIILHNYYTDTLGTASRSALFTGKYPLRLGTQGASIKAAEDRGIPISEQLLPAYLQNLGYKTHLLGKWDVGKSREHYLPTNRGFDTFYGFLGSSVDYFTYNTIENWDNISYYGLDLFDNTSPVINNRGHLTDLLTERAKQVIRDHDTSTPLYLHVSHAAPHTGGGLVNLQPPEDTIAPNDHIAHSARRLYAGLVTSLDRSVGHIVTALAERDILKNTLIVFVSDNGAPSEGVSQHFGSNLPLRGMKNTPWEGGVRSIAFLWHPLLQPEIRYSLFHVTDWLPTIVDAAGGNVDNKVDGVNQWEAIKQRHPKRNDVLITIDDQNGWAALREGDFKIIVGDVNKDISHYFGIDFQTLRREPPLYEKVLLECETYYVLKETLDMTLSVDEASTKRNENNLLKYKTNMENLEACVPTLAKGCLFNISGDPLEISDLWYALPEITKKMSLRLRTLWAELKPRVKPQLDLRADPSKNNYIWFPWVPNNETVIQPDTITPVFPMHVSIGELQYLVDLNLSMFKEKVYDSIKYMGNSFMKTVGGLFNFPK